MNSLGKRISQLLVLLGGAFITSAIQAEGYDYYNEQGIMIYAAGYGEQKKIVSQFPEIQRGNLRLVANISGERELVTGYIPSDQVNANQEEYHWVTDGHVILWRGKIVNNLPGAPTVDIASFQALGRFAVDKYSLYFDGQRTESNSGASQVDLATLKAIEGNSTTLVDRHNLYLLGRRQASSKNFSVIQSKWWGNTQRLYPPSDRDHSRDLLIRSQQSIFLNGRRITGVDVDTFHIIRWLPNSLLVYRDKHGEHRYLFGSLAGKIVAADDEDSFEIGEKTVHWRKQLSRNLEWSSWREVPNIDPEQFHLITNRIAQYQDHLYITRLSPFGEDRLDVITLDAPDLVIGRIFNGGRQHIYFVHNSRWSQDVQVMETVGSLTKTDRFAYDDRYVYTWSDTQVFKTLSPCPAQTTLSSKEEDKRDVIIITNASSCRKGKL
ncbi:DKNYY domain-containing protein [Citrobacter sp. FP75]|uniref:DKNYY domain-containing protein n=1 Tax=Citrobacter sp. FP75 TaxID=1852949 RepID=UPI001BC92179|nr:DKNYY domain-containing protein [Citrobacter sp. FP75]